VSWLEIGALEDIPVRGARLIKTKLGCVAVFRTGEDQVFAVDDRCPHKGQGRLEIETEKLTGVKAA